MKDSCSSNKADETSTLPGKKKKKKGPGWMFNPYEVTFCGYSGSGKTTLISKVLKTLSDDYSIAYIKHDGHKFELDKEGKDTYKAAENGAQAVHINDKERSAVQYFHQREKFYQPLDFVEYDFAIIEGYKSYDNLPKIVVLDEDLKILELYQDNLESVLAFVGADEKAPSELPEGVEYFQRDRVDDIIEHLFEFFVTKTSQRPVKGIVLVGGHSTRMKTDKASLNYHGVSQARYCADLLKGYCDEVYLSCRSDQDLPEDCADLVRLEDVYLNMGPSGGILSAFHMDKDSTYLVIGCDLPYVGEEALDKLTLGRNALKMATTFISTNDGMPEPLLSYYEPKTKAAILKAMAVGSNGCPRKVLLNNPIQALEQESAWLENINTPEEFESAKKSLK